MSSFSFSNHYEISWMNASTDVIPRHKLALTQGWITPNILQAFKLSAVRPDPSPFSFGEVFLYNESFRLFISLKYVYTRIMILDKNG